MTEENKVTLQTVENTPQEAEVAPMRVREPVKVGGGAVVITHDDQDKEPEATVDSRTTHLTNAKLPSRVANRTRGLVSVLPPKDSKEDIERVGDKEEMQEVSYEEYMKSKQSAITNPGTNAGISATQRVNDLVGKSAQEARLVLDDMKANRQLVSYRFVPIGMPMSLEVEPGRVQVLVDASKRVIDVNVS
jgi:hypothetical protein